MNTETIICSEDIKICIEDQNLLKNVSMNIKNIANIQFENITGENVEKKQRKFENFLPKNSSSFASPSCAQVHHG